MPKPTFSDAQLQAYLDESLPVDSMSSIEQQLRIDSQLQEKLVSLAAQREAGVHGLGEIWRRNRMSCPTRQLLGSFLLKAVDEDFASYIIFHLEQVGCRLCAANLQDLRQRQAEQENDIQSRRRRYFQTSAGFLKREK